MTQIVIGENLSVESLLSLLSIYKSRFESVSFVVGECESEIKTFCEQQACQIRVLLMKKLSLMTSIEQQIRIIDILYQTQSCFGEISISKMVSFLLENESNMSEFAKLQLVALKYYDGCYDSLKEEFRFLSEKIEEISKEIDINPGGIDYQKLRMLRMGVKVLGRPELLRKGRMAFRSLSRRAIAEGDKQTLRVLAEEIEFYWLKGKETCYEEIVGIAEALDALAGEESQEEQLAALSVRKYIDSRYEIDLSCIQDEYGNVWIAPDFDLRYLTDLMKYQKEKSKQGGADETMLLSKIYDAALESLFDHLPCMGRTDGKPETGFEKPEQLIEIFGKPIRQIRTETLVELLEIDFYLSETDENYCLTDAPLHTANILSELENRTIVGDKQAREAIKRYDARTAQTEPAYAS